MVTKLDVIIAVLEGRSIRHGVVKCRDCLSQRHLLSKIFASCIEALNEGDNISQYEKVDNLNALLVNLKKLMSTRLEKKLVAVVDGIDKQKGAGPTLLAALARIGDEVRLFSKDLRTKLTLHPGPGFFDHSHLK